MDAQTKYENIHADEHEHDDSSTEVDESLLGDEKQWHEDGIRLGQRPKRTRLWKRLGCVWWIVDTALLLVILGLLVRDQLRQPAVNKWDFGGDFTGVGPRGKKTRSRLWRDLAVKWGGC